MIRFDSSNIVVGEIKQLLKDFNLPKAGVPMYGESLIEGKVYIKDGSVYRGEYDKAEGRVRLKRIESLTYDWGDAIPNITHTLNVRSSIYDAETHRHLGNYLRFLRDYKGIDLMPMYNCFSNESPGRLDVSFTQDGVQRRFSTSDDRYMIYMVPVRLGRVYTISMTTSMPVEMFCGYYANNTMLRAFTQTYRKMGSCSMGECFVYDALKYSLTESGLEFSTTVEGGSFSYDSHRSSMVWENGANYFDPPIDGVRSFVRSNSLVYDEFRNNVIDADRYLKYGAVPKELLSKEDCLYLFIKVAGKVSRSIAVLEGDYSDSTEIFINSRGCTEVKYRPSVYREDIYSSDFKAPVPRLQLLSQHGPESYPFSDKLMQYLSSHAVTGEDPIPENIKKVQSKLLSEGYLPNIRHYGIWTDDVTAACLLCSHKSLKHREVYKDFDCIGYLDSDVEDELGGID